MGHGVYITREFFGIKRINNRRQKTCLFRGLIEMKQTAIIRVIYCGNHYNATGQQMRCRAHQKPPDKQEIRVMPPHRHPAGNIGELKNNSRKSFCPKKDTQHRSIDVMVHGHAFLPQFFSILFAKWR